MDLKMFIGLLNNILVELSLQPAAMYTYGIHGNALN